MKIEKRVLLTTMPMPDEGYWDNFRRDTQRRVFTYSFPRINSFGLRFLKYNIPKIGILEYPTHDEYVQALEKGYDIVGYSFYVNEIDEIIGMIKTAKRARRDVEIWGGNYGALTPGIEEHFDELMIGYGEERIAAKLGLKIDRIRHPPLIWYVQTSFGLKINPVGILFTTRGCPLRCDFCQTPSFCSKPQKITLESIKEVIEIYRERGIREVIIYDENFSLFPKHTRKVIELLAQSGIHWFCMTTVDHLSRNWREWYEMNMLGAFIGIESFSQDTLASMNKITMDASDTVDFVKEVHEFIYLLGFFIIGYEGDTGRSVTDDVNTLRGLKLDHTQIRILTPLPRTPLWDDIEDSYGIFERDWSRYDTMHLVWNHPHFEPDELRKLLIRSLLKCHPRTYLVRSQLKFARRFTSERGFFRAGLYLLKNMWRANTLDYTSR